MRFSESDSEDYLDSNAFGAGVPTHVQAGYENYGRPPLSLTTSDNLQPESSEGDGSSIESDDEPTTVAPPVQPRGKTFRPPRSSCDGGSSSSEDEDQLKPSSNDAIATAQVVNPNPGPPRGKELRLIMKGNDKPSGAKPVARKKTKVKPKSKCGSGKSSASAPKKAAAKASSKQSKASESKKRELPPVNDSDSGSDDEDPVAAVVCEGSDGEDIVMAVAENIDSNKRHKTNTTTRKTCAKKTAATKKSTRKSGSKKGRRSSAASAAYSIPEVSAERAESAKAARHLLQEAVTRLPHEVTERHTVRSFGRIKPEYDVAPLDALYSSLHAIYPVGFSCDRMEFSPVHGRVIKLRCDILDGSRLREQREEAGKDQVRTMSEDSETTLEERKMWETRDALGNFENISDGPIFRVTWGEGLEEEKLLEPSCPFHPYVASADLGEDVDAIAVPLSSRKDKLAGLPDVGRRVSVRFDKGTMLGGLITKVKPIEKQAKSKKAVCNITILYDDGVSEVAAFPDPDITVAYQGCPPVETASGLVLEMNGKQVRSVLANSPLEAWGKTLISLGLIDEIIYEAAMRGFRLAQEEGFNEGKEKLDESNKKRRDVRPRRCPSRYSLDGDDDTSQGTDIDGVSDVHKNETDQGDKQTDQSPEEIELRKKLSEMRKQLEIAEKRAKAASTKLANVRITAISPFAANPFLSRADSATGREDSAPIEASWLVAAIKKERAKMGNTGNKRKLVNPATLMDKNDTFFVPEIERLVEGLPGTELVPSYVFHANRSTAANPNWINEAKLRHQKQQQRKHEKAQERAKKMAKQAEVRAKAEHEKELKRKLKEEEVAGKKRLKEEEEDKKRRERIEKRLSQLTLQMDDRLFKEACMMREKNIMNFVRGMNKEFTRRRRAVELVVGHKIDQSTSVPFMISSSNTLAPFEKTLPPLSNTLYDVEVVRVWDFLHSFSGAFSTPNTPTSLPSLDSFQDAISCLKSKTCDQRRRSTAIKLLKAIAIDLCKVISPSLTKILSSSTANVETIGKKGTNGGPQEDADLSCLPVTEWSWREIARMAIVYDVLTDIGYSKQESANLVKGYRSGGHPNSKEARRWKKIEESPVVMMYHHLQDEDGLLNQQRRRMVRTSLSAPSIPSCVSSDWRFFLHNIKSGASHTTYFLKENVSKSLNSLKKNSSEVKDLESFVAELEKCLSILEKPSNCNSHAQVKQIVVNVLDATRGKCPFFALQVKEATQQNNIQLMANQVAVTQEPSRQKMGFQKMYQISKEQFKAFEQSKEEYMEAALLLKEELEGKTMDEANDDDDDDDDEVKDIESSTQKGKPGIESNMSGPNSELNGELEASANSAQNGKNMELEKQENEASGLNDKKDPSQNGNNIDPEKQENDASDLKDKKDPKTADSLVRPINEATGEVDEYGQSDKLLPENSSFCDPVESFNPTGHPTVSDKDAHLPTEPAGEGFPDGWVIRRITRKNLADKRTDRNWYSPKLGLRFRTKTDALRFLEKLENTQGDEVAAITDFHEEKKPKQIANKISNRSKFSPHNEVGGNKNEFDFCEDIPSSPDLIRRCLAVLRTLCASSSSENFIYPVDPQLYPSYYETVMKPTSLYDVGKLLQEAGKKFLTNHGDPEIEDVVANVGRKVRTIVQNSICVNSSNSIVNSSEEMQRIFERLFFDWVLAPSTSRPDIENLDDDRCIEHHESDVDSMVLLCDACEGKYNMDRLKPALTRVPSGDWYCPRCVSGRNWMTADPRLKRKVQNGSFNGTVQSCKFLFTEDGKPRIMYCIKAVHSSCIEYWGVEDVDRYILGEPVEPLRCLQALAESPGYGFGRDSGIVGGAVPVAINPLVSDKAAQAVLSSGVFKDTVSVCVSLTNPPEDFMAEEWTNLLMLLVTKCSLSDDFLELSSKLENREASRLSSEMMMFWRARAAKNIVPKLHDEDTDEDSDSEEASAHHEIPLPIENKTKDGEQSLAKDGLSTDIIMKQPGEEASIGNPPSNMGTGLQNLTEIPEEVSGSTCTNALNHACKDAVISEDVLRRKREALALAISRRERKREEALMGYYVGNRLKLTAVSFQEDSLSTIVKSALCTQEEGLNLSAVRCRELCHYCGMSDIALGAPLCRTPNEKEWRETFPHAVHDRTTYMIAEIPDKTITDFPTAEENTKVLTVRVRVGGELISSKTKCIDNIKNFDSAMQQFLPTNPIGFQSEVRFRHATTLPILSGSLTAHEVCAISAHRSRKEKLLAEHRSYHRSNMTREAALACGKSVPIGNDTFGRSYWVFSAEPTSLFVCQVDPKSANTAPTRKQWHMFRKPEEIASVMVCMGQSPLCDTLKQVFPEATKMLKDRSWSTLLFARRLGCSPKETAGLLPQKGPKPYAEEQIDYGPPFVEDEDVLVESAHGKLLWDAVIVDVSKDPDTSKVNGYLVHFKKWSSRFDQWVVPDRIVEPNKINLEVQDEVLEDFSIVNDAVPPTLEKMFAYNYLNAKKRARSTPASKSEIFGNAFKRQRASCDENLLGLLKGAILLIEAALPRGSIMCQGKAFRSWNSEIATLWCNLVKDARGPESLMKCVLLLEDAISPDWLHSQATQLYAAVPKPWRAMGEASLPAIALRVSILDRCLKYQQKKRKHVDPTT